MMQALLVSVLCLRRPSQTVVAYLSYLLEAGTISAKSLQPYLSAINAVHNDFEYPPPACGHLAKLARKRIETTNSLQHRALVRGAR